MAEPGSPVAVLSIVGPGRSGSTLLAGILGELPGVVDVGELRWLWQRGVLEGRPCGCGAPPVQCPVWCQVLARTVGALSTPGNASAADREVVDIVAAQDRLARRSRRVRVIRSAREGGAGCPDLRRVRSVTGRLLEAIAATTGARVIVDASKRPIDAAVVAGLPGVDHYVLHLVRDPRAVAFSWRRSKELAGPGSNSGQMAKRGLVGSAERWTENNLGTELLRRYVPSDRWMRLRYEDFVAAPREALAPLLGMLGATGPSPVGADGTVELGRNHTVAGNPVRFRTGPVPIRADDEWRSAMTGRQKALVTGLTLPLLRRYGYPVSAGAGR